MDAANAPGLGMSLRALDPETNYHEAGAGPPDRIDTERLPGRPLEINFQRCNGRPHPPALAELPKLKKIIVPMVEATELDDVGRALCRRLARDIDLSLPLGRHSNDAMLSFYRLNHSEFHIKCGSGGLQVVDETRHGVRQ